LGDYACMRILHINASDTSGGAARATYRLHRALLQEGLESRMLVQRKFSDDHTVIGPQNITQKIASHARHFLDSFPVRRYKQKSRTLFSPSWLPFSGIAERINLLAPDIVHLHWICGGMLRIEELAKIQVPMLWSLHDMWAFTGGCHSDQECGGYKNSCGNCLVLRSDSERDLSRKVFLRKQKTFHRCKDLKINALSGWLADCARQSSLFKDHTVFQLPNPIDTDLFKPVEKNFSRDLLNLPQNKKIVLFGAMGATVDPNKGFKELSQALTKLQSNNIELVVFGSGEPLNPPDLGFPTHYMGYLFDHLSLKVLYSASDVMVVPSLQEAFGQTASESMACGTPVVSFAATGLLDIVDHKQNGYLAVPYEPSDLASGIDWVLNSSEYRSLCNNAREKIVREFESSKVAKQYMELYSRILSKGEVS
jgi:glycosyltransferase involved in cell wall biosynthesis